MELPREVVQHIFTLRGNSNAFEFLSGPLLTLRDRVRCQAVCRAWREYLSPASWPLERLIIGWEGSDELEMYPPAQWTFQTKPAARAVYVGSDSVEAADMPDQFLPQLCSYLSVPHPELRELGLALSFEPAVVHALWSAVCALPGVTSLYLYDRSESFLTGGRAVSALPSTLERLELCNWGEAELRWPKPLLLCLSQLVVGECWDRFEVDAVLPSLRELRVDSRGDVILAGVNLALPQLTLLDICNSYPSGYSNVITVRVDFGRIPLLSSLRLSWLALAEPSASSFASLAHLTSLTVECSRNFRGGSPTSETAAVSLLRQAPATLRSLRVTNFASFDGLPQALAQLTGLVSLKGYSTAAVLPLLGSVSALQELEVRRQYDDDVVGLQLTYQGLNLSRLTQLTKLTADSPSIIPHLGPLSQLEELCLDCTKAAALSLEDTDFLAAMPSLCKLRFSQILGAS